MAGSDESTPLSYQTTMPEYPDVSYDAYKGYLGNPESKDWGNPIMNSTWNRSGYAMFAHMNGYEDYDTWRTNQLDAYQNKMSAYNTWLTTGAGKRASALSGDYSPSYFDASGSPASPAGYNQTDLEGSNPYTAMATGISGLFDIMKALQGFQLVNSQIKGVQLSNAGQELSNQKQAIENNILPSLLLNRSNLYGYQAGSYKFPLEIQLAKRYGVPKLNPETGLIDGSHMAFANMDYNLMDADKAFGYQQGAVDISYREAAEGLSRINAHVSSLNAKEKKFYIDEVLPWVKVQAIETAGLTSARKFSEREHKRLMSRQGKKLEIQNVYEKDLKELEVKGKKYGLSKKALDSVLSVAKEARGWVSTFVPHKSMRL